MVLLILCAYVFLWVPDLDLALLPLLHHRSIITHSVLPGLLFLFLGRRLGAAPAAGALTGLSVHLSCDLLSPMIGFAQVWLPAPLMVPLGPLSYLWLAGNAVFGFAVALRIAGDLFLRYTSLPITAVVGGLTGATYGLINEGSLMAAVTVLTVLGMSWMTLGRRDPSCQRLSGARSAR